VPPTLFPWPNQPTPITPTAQPVCLFILLLHPPSPLVHRPIKSPHHLPLFRKNNYRTIMNTAATPSTSSKSLKLASTSQTLPHGHLDYVLDMAFDYYGRRFATASGDRTVRVWDLNSDGMWMSNSVGDGCTTTTNEWQAHRGAVHRISWAHPEFRQLLATAGSGEWKNNNVQQLVTEMQEVCMRPHSQRTFSIASRILNFNIRNIDKCTHTHIYIYICICTHIKQSWGILSFCKVFVSFFFAVFLLYLFLSITRPCIYIGPVPHEQ